ncbi:thiol-disulfide oxidoreductase DCC family protein [Geitlerinema sp. PCC 7407]|uniref:thiol-disulfide oxidoreductase DCC family protein n=1 Tax=Geitlerinema sp. PCC 7407 TaxID=1173025 RepID=UPI00029F92AE|nr:DCC1-like thiol-disulfide oxidoreductase family protein [Geitlerinema sp. PCC 7407]AFY67226.1 thiol-disulfide oxidoreductase DCC [Geitlerinema sp. PCC 7407]
MAAYYVIYDGNCNLCVNLVKVLEQVDRGDRFQYVPMQDTETLGRFGITPQDCEMGMILLDGQQPSRRWQGSDAAEEIGRLLPGGSPFVQAYRALPGAKWVGDRVYAQVRDRRYEIFGRRDQTYHAAYGVCDTGTCGPTGRTADAESR